MELIVRQSAQLCAALHPPGDKSITHRAIILGTLANGCSRIKGWLQSADISATISACKAIGADIQITPRELVISGTGGALREPSKALDLGNAGTGIRLLTGAICGRDIHAELTGDASLKRRPMERIITPLTKMGAQIGSVDQRIPITIEPSSALKGIRYRLPVASAQVKSAILLAGLTAAGETWVCDPFSTRDHTERLLPVFGCQVRRNAEGWIGVSRALLSPAELSVPGDFSSAAFLIVAALITQRSHLVIREVGVNPTRAGLLSALIRMGASINLAQRRPIAGEPVADIECQSHRLSGVHVPPVEVPRLIDELPILMVAAAYGHGTSVFEGIEELRHKESNRLEAMVEGLNNVGVPVSMNRTGDTLRITGRVPSGGVVDARQDHRIAMAFAIAGLGAKNPIRIRNCDLIETSWPNFVDTLRDCGARLEATK